jgi:AraC family ethanolamine operon transcriptional activator
MVDWKEHTPFTGYLSRLPVAESVLVQLDPGDLALASIDVRGQDSFVVRFRTGARSIWTMVPEKEWIGFLVPISWSGDYLLNGLSATPNTVFRLDGAHQYDVVAERRDAVTIGVRRSVLARAVASLTGREYSADPQGIRSIEVPDGHRGRLTSILRKLIAGATEYDSERAFRRVPHALENDMISAVADWMIETDDLETGDLAESRSDLKIVRDALNSILQSRSAKLSLADLCREVGVSKSRLHRAFSEVHGISPGHYIYRSRLISARERLLAADDRPRSIKEVSIQCGFLSSGQFARAYYSMFGELPNETFARQTAAPIA